MSIQVIACLNPFSQERKVFNFEQGLSVQQIINKIDALHAVNTGWRVMIDDEIITDFECIPEENQRVYIKLIPEGDNKDTGVGMKVSGGLLAAVGVVLLFTPLSAVGAGLIGAGVGLFAGGVTLYNMNIPGDREKPETDPSIRGSRNTPRPYGTVPTLFGRRRIYADPCANPYTWVDPTTGAVYLYQLFCVGQKDLEIDAQSLKIDETFLKDYSSSENIENVLDGSDPIIHLQIAYGENRAPLYDKCVHEIQLNALLKHQTEEGLDGEIVRTTPDKTTEINVDVFAYNGLGKYKDDGTLEPVAVEIKAEYKLVDSPDTDYQLLGYFNNGSNELSGNELKTKRFAITKSNLAPAAYTVRLSRVSEDSSDSKVIDSIYVGSIRACKSEAPVRSEICRRATLIGLKIKATDKLQNIVEQLNFVAQSKLPVYKPESNSWIYELTSNPASAAMYAMQGDFAQQKLLDSDIDFLAFQKLYLWCNEHEYECNAYVTDSMSINELLSAIASTCRAEILRMNGKITVIQDIERDSYVQLFTPRNSSGYKETMALSDIPDEMKMQFVDEESGFAENEVSVYNTPSGNKSSEPVTSQKVTLWGITKHKQAQRIGLYNYAVSNHRFSLLQFNCDFEYLMCQKGDWIKYAGDIALAGITQGRIAELITEDVGVIGIVCDEQIPMESGKNYAVRVRKSSGESDLLNVVNNASTSNTIMLETPIAIPDAPEEGDLFSFGERGNDSVDLIVTDIQCGENLSATLTCVEYRPEIFAVDSPDYILPEYENKLSETSVESDSGALSPSDWKTFFTYNDSEEKPEYMPVSDGTNDGWHLVKTTESKWVASKTSKSIYDGDWNGITRLKPSPAKFVELIAPNGLVFKNNAPAQLPLEVKSTGFIPTSYKWYKDGQEISGATGSTYNVDSASPGVYKVVVDNKYEDYVTVISVIDGEWDSVYQCVIEKGVAPEMEVEDGDSLVLDDEQGVLQTESEENRKNCYRITVYKDGNKASETLYARWRYEKFKEYIGSTPTYEWTNFENITITNGEAYVRTDHETIRQIQCSVFKNSNYDTMVCTGITNNEKAASYHLETRSNTIKSTFEGTYSPSELTVNGKQKVSSNPGDFEGYFKIFYSLVPNPTSNDWQPAYSSESQEASHTWPIAPNGIQLIKCQLYADEDFENLLEEDIIPITKDGKDSKGYNVSVSNENFAIPTDAENLKPLENTSVTVEFTAFKGADELNATKENTILQSQFKLTFPQSQEGISVTQDNSHPQKLTFTATTTKAISRSQNLEITFTFSDGTQLKKNVTITATTQGPKGDKGGYMDYKYLKAAFGLSREELLASTDWQKTQPAPEEGKCIYMASKWID